MSDSLRPHGLYIPWNYQGQNTGMGSSSLLQGVFLTQGSNPCLPHCQEILYQLSHQGSPRITGVGRLSLLQWIFLNQELNWGLLHCRWIFYQLRYQVFPDLLDWEVMWALGNITMNKPSGGDGIPAELFQILKDGAVKVCTHLTANLENSAGATGLENSVFIPVPKKGKECQRMPKNAQTTTRLHSSQMLAK